MQYLIRIILLALLTSLISSCTSNSAWPPDKYSQSATLKAITQDLAVIDAQFPPAIHELLVPSHGEILSGLLLTANGAGPHATVILLHGYPGNEKNLDLAQSMRRAGFNVLFFHYRGAWGSSGDYALSHLSEDVAAVLSFVRSESENYRIDTDKLSLIGHSMGGFTALRAGARDQNVVCVGGLAAANLGEYSSRPEAARRGFSQYTDKLIMLNNFSGDKALAELTSNAKSFDVRNDAIGLVGKSVFLITGDQDTAVPPAVQQRIAEAYRQQSGLSLTALNIPGDHSFSTNRIRLQQLVIDWLLQDCQ